MQRRNVIKSFFGMLAVGLVAPLQVKASGLVIPSKRIPQITSNDQLEEGKYYLCYDRNYGREKPEYLRCDVQAYSKSGPVKAMGPNCIWAADDNNQALERWDIYGPYELPLRAEV